MEAAIIFACSNASLQIMLALQELTCSCAVHGNVRDQPLSHSLAKSTDMADIEETQIRFTYSMYLVFNVHK
jgi:hypothetical protein